MRDKNDSIHFEDNHPWFSHGVFVVFLLPFGMPRSLAMISGIAGSTRKHLESGPGSIKPPAISWKGLFPKILNGKTVRLEFNRDRPVSFQGLGYSPLHLYLKGGKTEETTHGKSDEDILRCAQCSKERPGGGNVGTSWWWRGCNTWRIIPVRIRG